MKDEPRDAIAAFVEVLREGGGRALRGTSDAKASRAPEASDLRVQGVGPESHRLETGATETTAEGGWAPTPSQIESLVRQVGPGVDLVGVFEAAARKQGVQVHCVAGGDWPAAAAAILMNAKARRVVVQPEADRFFDAAAARRLAQELARACGEGACVTFDLDEGTLFDADAVVTGARSAVAETGSLVCDNASGRARGATLIPPLHIAVLHAREIRADLFDVLADPALARDLPTNLNLITGPSKTADVEGVLVTGVHGPGQVHAIIVSR